MPKSKKREAASQHDVSLVLALAACEIKTQQSRYPVDIVASKEALRAYVCARPLIKAAPKMLEACKIAQVRIFMVEGSENPEYKALTAAIQSAESGGK